MSLNQYYVIFDLFLFQKGSNPFGSIDIINNGDVAQLTIAFVWQY